MTSPILNNRRLQSLALIMAIAVIAIVGLLLIMNNLAAPDETASVIQETPSADSPPSPTPNIQANNAGEGVVENDIVATVNEQVITRVTWNQASRLDIVMSRLARQSRPTAEETLDRLVNEIIVLNYVTGVAYPDNTIIENRISALEESWNMSDEEVTIALQQADLTRSDFIQRMGRLIQVETALGQLAAQEDDLNRWLADARAGAEIGLLHTLVAAPMPQSQQIKATQEPISNTVEEAAIPSTDLPVAPYQDNAAPDFTLPQLNGDALTLSDFRGKPTIVNFWASWCPPCRRELPALQTAYTQYGDKIGFVAVDVKEDPATVADFVENMQLGFPIVLDEDGQISNVIYEVRGIPTTVFVDANGIVTARHVGPLDEATIDEYLTPLLEQTEQVSSTNDGAPTPSALTIITSDGIISAVGDNTPPPDSVPTNNLTLAPGFTATSGQGDTIALNDYRGQSNVVLVFYRGNT